MSETLEAKHKKPFPPRWATFLMGCVIVCGVILGVGLQLQSMQNARTAQANSQTLAEEIKRVCATNGTLRIDDRDLCAKAKQVQADPTQPLPRPKGDKGDTGTSGSAGPAGAVGATGLPGKTGAAGATGDTGSPGTAGPAGQTGLIGATGEQGEPGTSGAPGKDGSPGKDGASGKDGRGITGVECVGTGDASYWLITYTDGTTAQSSGPCRLTTALPPITTPTP